MFIPVATFFAVFFAMVVVFIATNGKPVLASDSHTVILSHDKRRATVPTRASTVGEFLQRAGLTLNEGDIVEPSADTQIDADNFRINVYRAQPVLVIDGDKRTFAFSAATTPRSVAKQAGVEVYAEDKIDSQMTTSFLEEGSIGQKVVIDRATQSNLNLYGTAVEVRTHAKTVGELLKEKNVTLAADDTVTPALDTQLASASQIFVMRNGTKIETVEEAIPMKTEYVEDPSLSFGTKAVRQAGSAGKRLVTYQIDLLNGKETGRHVIQTVTAQEPVTQIIARGRAVYISGDHESLMAAAGISPSDYAYVDYIVSRESGWCPTKLQGNYGSCPAYAPDSIPNGLGYGMCQSTPGSKMATAGADWQTNPVTQLRWCSSYASRYGGWEGAYNTWVAKHWW